MASIYRKVESKNTYLIANVSFPWILTVRNLDFILYFFPTAVAAFAFFRYVQPCQSVNFAWTLVLQISRLAFSQLSSEISVDIELQPNKLLSSLFHSFMILSEKNCFPSNWQDSGFR